MSHSSIRLRGPKEHAHRGCRFTDRSGHCERLPERILALPNDPQKRHLPLCVQHTQSFKKDQPSEYRRRLDLSILEWRNYAIETYGSMPLCRCVGCQVVS